jgi:hypothetical protein
MIIELDLRCIRVVKYSNSMLSFLHPYLLCSTIRMVIYITCYDPKPSIFLPVYYHISIQVIITWGMAGYGILYFYILSTL